VQETPFVSAAAGHELVSMQLHFELTHAQLAPDG
jgi:hypothetical protein